jgi:hypothetical protein
MAVTTAAFGPTDRTPDRTRGEWQTGHLIGDGTTVAVARGNGELGPIWNNIAVAGTVDFHDAIEGASLDATNRLLRVDTTAAGQKSEDSIAFRQGLQVVTSAATNDVTFNLWGRATLNPRQFGVA